MSNCDRRDFLRISAGVALGPWAIPRWLHATSESPADRTLVLLQLTGGNDGLNTVIPIDHDAYHRARPTLRIPENQASRLDDGFALHPSLTACREMFRDGRLSVLHGVGYPRPNRSHFRSLDIWHSANPDHERPTTGWIGRAADQEETTGDTFAVRLGGRDLPLLLTGADTAAPCIDSLDDWRLDYGPRAADRRRDLASLHAIDRASDASGNLEFIRGVGRRAMAESDELSRLRLSDQGDRFPSTRLGRSLALASTFIDSKARPRVIFVSHDGFDTHSRQRDPHASLLAQLSTALGAFLSDLARRGIDREVLVCVYSEFGRRVAENASGGTDHGAAQPVLLVSGAVKGGLHGTFPSFDDLDAGDLRHTCDFRQLYATLLERWLKIPAEGVLGHRHPTLDLLES